MYRSLLLGVTAFVEMATGIALLASPATPLSLLLGVGEPSLEAYILARLAGAALLSIGVNCWMVRNVGPGPATVATLVGLLIYNVGAAAILGHAGLVSPTVGPVLWPAVGLHTVLAVWCVLCLWEKSP